MTLFRYYEWLDYKEHEELKTLMDWKPTWIPIIAFPELVHQWKLHFAESPNAGQFSIGKMRGKEEGIGYGISNCIFCFDNYIIMFLLKCVFIS